MALTRETKKAKKKRRIEWHSAFVAAMKLELKDYKEHLTFVPEYELTGRPKYIDLVLIKNDGIEHEEGLVRLFSKHNIIEYKGVGDRLGLDTFYKGIAYTCMYATEPKQQDNDKADKAWNKIKNNANRINPVISDNPVNCDITLFFVREAKPVKLLRQLREQNCPIVKEDDGIYTVDMKLLFRIQIIVLGEIDFHKHLWIASLTNKIDEQRMKMLLGTENNKESEWEYRNAIEVIEAVIQANREVFDKLRERNCEDMKGIMWECLEPEINEYVDEKLAEKDEELVKKDERLAEKEAELAEKDAEINRLLKRLAQVSCL